MKLCRTSLPLCPFASPFFPAPLSSLSPLRRLSLAHLKCKHAKEGLALLPLHFGQLVGLRAQRVALPQLEHGAQVDGVVPAVAGRLAALRPPGALTRRPHAADQRHPAPHGVGVAPYAVAERRRLGVAAVGAAGDAVGRLAVDEVQAALGDDDLVVEQLEAPLGEGLALGAQPLQLTDLRIPFV